MKLKQIKWKIYKWVKSAHSINEIKKIKLIPALANGLIKNPYYTDNSRQHDQTTIITIFPGKFHV